MHRDAVHRRCRGSVRRSLQPGELDPVARREDRAHERELGDGSTEGHQRPHTRTGRWWPRPCSNRATERAAEARRPLMSSMKVVPCSSASQELGQPQPRSGGGGHFPAVPEERERTGRLQVAHLEPPPVLVDVALDDVGPDRVGGMQPRERVAGPVGDRQGGTRWSPALVRLRCLETQRHGVPDEDEGDLRPPRRRCSGWP